MFDSMDCDIINTFIKVAHFHIEGIMRWLSSVSNKPIESILLETLANCLSDKILPLTLTIRASIRDVPYP